MTVLSVVSCRSSRTAARASLSRQDAEHMSATSQSTGMQWGQALVTVGAPVADTLDLLLTREMADSLPLGASVVRGRGTVTLTVEKTAKGLRVMSRTPRTGEVKAEVRGEWRHEASVSEESSRRVSEETSATAQSSPEVKSPGCWLMISLGACLLVYLGILTWLRR